MDIHNPLSKIKLAAKSAAPVNGLVTSQTAAPALTKASGLQFGSLARSSFSPVAKLSGVSGSSVAFGHPTPLELVIEDKKRTFADRVGIWLSFICVIHCLATPFLLLVFPALEAMRVTQLHEGFHLALLLVLPIVAVIAFIPGFRKHQNREVFYWAVPGLMIIAYVAIWFDETSWLASAVSVTGSLFLIRAHVINRRLCACCLPPRSPRQV